MADFRTAGDLDRPGVVTISHAMVWDGTSASAVDLRLSLPSTPANAVTGSQSAGYGTLDTTVSSPGPHALVWTNNTAGSMVDLNPGQLGADNSYAVGVGGNQQVGYASVNGAEDHAILWTGSAASAVDLHPTSISLVNSQANATDGAHQVGYGVSRDVTLPHYDHFHPLLWSGTADSAVDLTPTSLPGITDAEALGVGGNQQVGDSFGSSVFHALLWRGTAGSAVDLHPTQFGVFSESIAYSTNGSEQVGVADFRSAGGAVTLRHAMLWVGTAASAVDLQLLLPANFVSSTAYSIDAAGDVFGIATDTSGVMHGIEWVPQVPEPSGVALVALGGLALIARR